ncbi:hypothetical protein BC937DRAFT_86220 [Endogone sp. FLAS-F59071]|nr:hypothetical protein BC937DRAFT_86220 [Endogone sp. FLAS-F59071]|eukprot:RUS13175.1 hypothetical protein BC937DRAFT_86220 [Endogone sp. FLAS-F59071]
MLIDLGHLRSSPTVAGNVTGSAPLQRTLSYPVGSSQPSRNVSDSGPPLSVPMFSSAWTGSLFRNTNMRHTVKSRLQFVKEACDGELRHIIDGLNEYVERGVQYVEDVEDVAIDEYIEGEDEDDRNASFTFKSGVVFGNGDADTSSPGQTLPVHGDTRYIEATKPSTERELPPPPLKSEHEGITQSRDVLFTSQSRTVLTASPTPITSSTSTSSDHLDTQPLKNKERPQINGDTDVEDRLEGVKLIVRMKMGLVGQWGWDWQGWD